MKVLRFCFRCTGKHSELLPCDLEISALFIEDLISLVLRGHRTLMIADTVKLSFSPIQNAYAFQVRIWLYEHCHELLLADTEDIELEVECLISRALLQLFWTVSVNEPDCWLQIK